MPYIPEERRNQFDNVGKSGHHPKMEAPGELAYELTLKLVKYLKHNGLDFQTISDILARRTRNDQARVLPPSCRTL